MFQQEHHKGLLRTLFWVIPLWALVVGSQIPLTESEISLWELSYNWREIPAGIAPLPVWLSAFFKSLFGDASWAIRLPSLLARILALALMMFWAADRWTLSLAKRGLWILMGSFASIFGALFANYESYFLCFAFLSIANIDRRKPIASGVLMSLALLCSPIAIGLVPGLFWAYTTQRRGGPKWLMLLLALLVFSFVTTLASYQSAYLNHIWNARSALTTGAVIFELSNVVIALGKFGGLTLMGAALWAVWSIFKRGLSAPVLGFNKSNTVRVPMFVWIAPCFLMTCLAAMSGNFRSEGVLLCLSLLCFSLGSVLGFHSRDEEQKFEWKMLLLSVLTMTFISVIYLQ